MSYVPKGGKMTKEEVEALGYIYDQPSYWDRIIECGPHFEYVSAGSIEASDMDILDYNSHIWKGKIAFGGAKIYPDYCLRRRPIAPCPGNLCPFCPRVGKL